FSARPRAKRRAAPRRGPRPRGSPWPSADPSRRARRWSAAGRPRARSTPGCPGGPMPTYVAAADPCRAGRSSTSRAAGPGSRSRRPHGPRATIAPEPSPRRRPANLSGRRLPAMPSGQRWSERRARSPAAGSSTERKRSAAAQTRGWELHHLLEGGPVDPRNVGNGLGADSRELDVLNLRVALTLAGVVAPAARPVVRVRRPIRSGELGDGLVQGRFHVLPAGDQVSAVALGVGVGDLRVERL